MATWGHCLKRSDINKTRPGMGSVKQVRGLHFTLTFAGGSPVTNHSITTLAECESPALCCTTCGKTIPRNHACSWSLDMQSVYCGSCGVPMLDQAQERLAACNRLINHRYADERQYRMDLHTLLSNTSDQVRQTMRGMVADALKGTNHG